MWPASERFRDTVAGTHRAITRAVLCAEPQFGPNPVGEELPILGGDVRLSASSDIKGTLDLTVPGDYWDLVQPYGNEIFVERGVDFGDGTSESVPLGYFRIERASQDSSPYGPIVIDGSDRIASIQSNRVLFPFQVPPTYTHRQLFHRLINGDPDQTGQASTVGYGIFIRTIVPITWENAGYDPDEAKVTGGQVVENSAYDFLAKLVDARGCVMRFLPTGELSIERRDPDTTAPVYTVRGGASGTMVSSRRSVTREGVFNIVSAHGSDPSAVTGYRLAYNDDPSSPLWWAGRFGPVVRYYASPLLRTTDQADEAARSLLSRSTGLPLETSVFLVPNPALKPLDVVACTLGPDTTNHVAEEITIPLAGGEPLALKCRTINTLDGIVSEEDYGTDPGDGTPSGPPSDGGGTPGSGGGTPGSGGGATLTDDVLAARDISARIASGQTIDEDLSWVGMPDYVKAYAHQLLDDYRTEGNTYNFPESLDDLRVWLDAYVAAHSGADQGTGGGTPGDPSDGTQAAAVFGWGTVVDGDEFDYTGTPGSKWGLYDGSGHNGNGRRSPSAFSVHDGMMTIHGENKVSGGTAFRGGAMGARIEVRARVYNTGSGSDRYHPVLILWPDSDEWPAGAEYDFFETDEGTGEYSGFLHLPNHTPYRQDQIPTRSLDLENWHNYAVEWNPSAQTLRTYLDGELTYEGKGRVAQAPGPMHLTIQLDDFGGSPRPCNFDIAWVRVYGRPNA